MQLLLERHEEKNLTVWMSHVQKMKWTVFIISQPHEWTYYSFA